MIRKDKKILKDGTVKTQIRVTQGYRPYPNSAPKQRTIKSFGYLEDQEDTETFWAEVHELNASLKKKRDLRIEIPLSEKMYTENNRLLNYGYKFLDSVYQLLEIDSFIDRYQKTSGFRGKYSLNEIFHYLVIDRILYPSSKREAASRLPNYYGLDSNFELPDIYRAFDRFDDFFYDLQNQISEKVREVVGRQLDYSFYDVTNYYTKKDFPDSDEEYLDRSGDLVTRSVLGQKEHPLAPIIQMGLFIDSNGIPVCMGVFRRKESNPSTLKSNVDDFKKEYGIQRTIVVADKGMNCPHNIDLLSSGGDGYVFSQVLNGAKGKRYLEDQFCLEGWHESEDGSCKCKLIEEEYKGHNICFETHNGKKNEVLTPEMRKRKVLLCWSEAHAEMAAKRRKEKLRQNEKSTKKNAYGGAHGKNQYATEGIVMNDTGGILEQKQISKVQIADREMAEKDAKYDGYFAIITSEMDYDAAKIRDVYHGLWKIKKSFRSMKSDLDARSNHMIIMPHIRANFLVCFTALVIVRMIQHFMGKERLSAERIADALREANCMIERGGYVRLLDVGGRVKLENILDKKTQKEVPILNFNNKDPIALDYRIIQDTFGTDFYYAYSKQEDFKRFFNDMGLIKKT